MFMVFMSSLRIAIVSMIVCVGGYTVAVWALAQSVSPFTANGSLLRAADGTVVGSRQIAQPFTQARYFWPRPSAVAYNGAAAGGSNLNPASADMRAQGAEMVARYGATADHPLPADLATASGAGLDPHISLAGALYQVPRVAQARGRTPAEIQALVRRLAFAPGGALTRGQIVNVLDLNLALDAH